MSTLMRRKKLKPDTRLDWRDPNMPVLRPAMAPGDTKYKPYEFRSDWITKYHQNAMISPRMEPTWKYDPSYNWFSAAQQKKL